MANRIWHPLQTTARNKVVIDGRFSPDTANPPTSVVGVGVASVVRTGVGTFLITLVDAFAVFESGHAQVQLNAAADTYAQLGAFDGTAKTVVLRTLTAGAAADIAANANNRVHFQLIMSNTG